jgi:6-pyruvoyltetrahydropterin/6-carboxytetrahydropterin synthase
VVRIMRVSKDFTFEAAHYLPNVPDWHKCKRLHGHHYTIRLTVEGPVDETLGWVQDYADIKQAFEPWILRFDHNCLNDIQALKNSTAENLAAHIWDQIKSALPLLCEVAVSEVPGCWVIYAP